MEYQSLLDCYSDGHFDSSKFLLARKKEHMNGSGHINDTPHDLMRDDDWGGEQSPITRREEEKKKAYDSC